jgi:hypothetical protein
VPYLFVKTKAITHGLIDRHAERPIGWGAAVSRGEHAQLSGIPKRNKHSAGTFVQRHWKIAAVVDRPTRCLFARKTVDYRDLARLRHVHEDAPVRAGNRSRQSWRTGSPLGISPRTVS